MTSPTSQTTRLSGSEEAREAASGSLSEASQGPVETPEAQSGNIPTLSSLLTILEVHGVEARIAHLGGNVQGIEWQTAHRGLWLATYEDGGWLIGPDVATDDDGSVRLWWEHSSTAEVAAAILAIVDAP